MNVLKPVGVQTRILLMICTVLVLFSSGCHQVTEYRTGESGKLYFIRSDDLQVESVMEGFPGAKVIVPGSGGEVILISSEGMLYRIDTSAMSVDTSYTIGGSSGTGYGDAAIADNGDLYVIGPGSQLLQVDLETNQTVDNFSPSSSPRAIVSSPNQPRLYLINKNDYVISEIKTYNNVIGFTAAARVPLADIMVDRFNGRFVLVAGSDYLGSIYGVFLDVSTSARVMNVRAGSPCSGIISLTHDSLYAVCCPRWSSENGMVMLSRGYMHPDSTYIETRTTVSGHPVAMTFNQNLGYVGYLSVLSRAEGGSALLTVMELAFNGWGLNEIGVVELDGYARDVICPGNGEYIVVLTSD
jgi:hypothetical protein